MGGFNFDFTGREEVLVVVMLTTTTIDNVGGKEGVIGSGILLDHVVINSLHKVLRPKFLVGNAEPRFAAGSATSPSRSAIGEDALAEQDEDDQPPAATGPVARLPRRDSVTERDRKNELEAGKTSVSKDKDKVPAAFKEKGGPSSKDKSKKESDEVNQQNLPTLDPRGAPIGSSGAAGGTEHQPDQSPSKTGRPHRAGEEQPGNGGGGNQPHAPAPANGLETGDQQKHVLFLSRSTRPEDLEQFYQEDPVLEKIIGFLMANFFAFEDFVKRFRSVVFRENTGRYDVLLHPEDEPIDKERFDVAAVELGFPKEVVRDAGRGGGGLFEMLDGDEDGREGGGVCPRRFGLFEISLTGMRTVGRFGRSFGWGMVDPTLISR